MFLPKKSVLALIFSSILVLSTAFAVDLPQIHAQISQEINLKNFWQWKAACDASYATQKTPLTQEIFLSELQAFVQSQNNGPLADKDKWVKTAFFRGKQMPSVEFYTTTKFEPYVQKLEVPTDAEVAFHGDVHGDIKSFNAFIEDLNNKGYMDPQDPFKIKKPNFYIIMLGDYTDRGEYGAEVLYAVMRMKQLNPNNFFMVRGNHEDHDINIYWGLYHELGKKFACPNEVMKAINRIYNYLPVALYLRSGANSFLCCHGGKEIGFLHAKKIKDAPGQQRFVLLDALKRATRVNALPNKEREAFSCTHNQDMPHYDAQDIGFMWNDFTFNHDTCNDRYATIFERDGRREYSEKITKYLLKHDSTPTCALRGVMRAHQHNHSTMEYILNRNGHTHAENTGVAKLWPPHDHMQQPAHALWDGIVCTFCVSPGAYGSAFNYNFDSYGILKTAEKFEDWRLAMTRLVTAQ